MTSAHLLLDVIFNDLLSFLTLLICKRISFCLCHSKAGLKKLLTREVVAKRVL